MTESTELNELLDSNPNKSENKINEIDGFELHEKINQLEILIHAAHPVMPILLKKIHDQLQKDPEQVTLLSEEEIGIIVSGLKRRMNTELITMKEPKEAKAKLKAKLNDINSF